MSYLDEGEFERWMRSALRTLESARRDLGGGDYNWACFKSHQAAEKALKAILWGVGRPKTGHALTRLIRGVGESLNVDISEDLIQACVTLDRYYIPTRCPNAWSEGSPEDYYTRRDAEEAIRLASLLVEWAVELWRKLSRRG